MDIINTNKLIIHELKKWMQQWKLVILNAFFPNLARKVLPMPVLTLETHEIFKGKNGQKLKASITCK